MPFLNTSLLNQTNYSVPYEFGNNTIHYLSVPNHLFRQSCHVWALGSLAPYLIPAGLISKAAVDLVSMAIPRIAPRKNAIGHQLPVIGKAVNWVWKNPIKSSVLSLVGVVSNSVLHILACAGEHLYTVRRWAHSEQNEHLPAQCQPGNAYDSFTTTAMLVTQELTDEYGLSLPQDFFDQWFRVPEHFYWGINTDLKDRAKNIIIRDPEFKNMTLQSSVNTTQFNVLVNKHISAEYKKSCLQVKDEL